MALTESGDEIRLNPSEVHQCDLLLQNPDELSDRELDVRYGNIRCHQLHKNVRNTFLGGPNRVDRPLVDFLCWQRNDPDHVDDR